MISIYFPRSHYRITAPISPPAALHLTALNTDHANPTALITDRIHLTALVSPLT